MRNAVPGFKGLLSRDELLDLAGNDNAESRFVSQAGGTWPLEHGPFSRARLRRRQALDGAGAGTKPPAARGRPP